jgi:hypothetical protein
LDEQSRFDENPDHYCIVRRQGVIVATLGVFLKTSQKKLPIDGVMWYSTENHGLQEIELGRFSFRKRPRTKTELLDIISITRFLLKNFYLHLEQEFGSYVVYFETYKTIIKLLTAAFGKAFIIPKKCLIRWDRIPEARRKFYSKFSEGGAGLYQVDLNVFRKSVGLLDSMHVCA